MRTSALATTALLLVLLAPAASGLEPSREEMVQALLARSRLLQDIHFSVPRPVWERFFRESLRGEGARPPVPMIVSEGRYALTVGADRKLLLKAMVRVRVLDAGGCGPVAVLASRRAWDEISIDGAPARLASRKTWLVFSPQAAGDHVVSAALRMKEAPASGATLVLPIPRSVQTWASFESPGNWVVSVAGAPTRLRGGAAGTRGTVALAPRGLLRVSFAPPQPHTEHPPRFTLSGPVVWNFDAGAQQVTARLDVGIVGGRADRLALVVPQGAERVSVRGPDLREARASGGQVEVFLRGKVGGRTRLLVSFEVRQGRGHIHRLANLGVRRGHWDGGTLVVTNTAGSLELLESAANGLRPLALGQVPPSARRLLAGRPALAYQVAARAWSAAVETVDLGEFALRESIADLAHYEVVCRPDGALLCRATYEVRNRTRQFLRLEVPRDAMVLLARVNEKPAPLTPLGQDGYLLPLERSLASVQGLVTFPVEVLYAWRGERLRAGGELGLPLPRIDLPIAYAWCEAYVPEGLRVLDWQGPLRRVERYSNELATTTLTYGRGLAAKGYSGRARPVPTARPSPAKPRKAKPRRWGWFGLGRLAAAAGVAPAPEPAVPPAQKPSVADWQTLTQFSLARNYYRAGKELYEKGDLAGARRSLEAVIARFPRSVEATNARRLLSNVRTLAGNLRVSSRGQKAAQLRAQHEVQAKLGDQLVQQHLYLERGLRAARQGQWKAAGSQLRAAEALGKELLRRGASTSEVNARLHEVRQALARLEHRREAEGAEVAKRLEELDKLGQLSGALGAAQRLRSLQKGKATTRMDELEERLERLVTETAREDVAKKRRKLPAAPGAVQVKTRRSGPAPRPVVRMYDISDLVVADGGAGRVVKVVERATSTNRPKAPGYGVRYRNGRLVVSDAPEVQAEVGKLLNRLRLVRGPQVEAGGRLAQQEADKVVEEETTADLEAATRRLASRSEFQRFLERNYSWQAPRGQLDPFQFAAVLAANREQKVNAESINVAVRPTEAQAVGVRFTATKAGLRYAIADEGQLRTLRELDARRAGERAAPPNERFQKTIVGTGARLANDMVAFVTYAGDEENRLRLAGASVRLPHDRYLVIDNGRYLTAVRVGPMEHWTAPVEKIGFAPVPQHIAVPAVGRLAKFEKTLVQPDDDLVIRASYRWKGERR